MLGSTVTLLSFLQSFSPNLTQNDLGSISPLLLLSLESLLSHLSAIEISRKEEKQVSEGRIKNLKNSLSCLTTHLEEVTSRLLTSESTLFNLKLTSRKELDELQEERDGMKILKEVWEGRYRSERRLREEMSSFVVKGRILNDRASIISLSSNYKPLSPPSRPTHSRHPSSSFSTSSSASDRTRRATNVSSPFRTPTKPRMSSKTVLAALSRELERVRREGDRLLFERDEEITRLEYDQSLVRREMSDLYTSIDRLLSSGSRLDTLAGSKLSFSSDTYNSVGQDRNKIHRTSRAIRLEEEVEALESEVKRLGGDKAIDRSTDSEAILKCDNRYQQLLQEARDLALTIQDLNSQISQLRIELREVSNEREVFQRLFEDARSNPTQHIPVLPPSSSPATSYPRADSIAKINSLEAEKSRLQTLLAHSHTIIDSLRAQLHSLTLINESKLEKLSERVKGKLLEQKDRIEGYKRRIEGLERELRTVKVEKDGKERRSGRRNEGEALERSWSTPPVLGRRR